MKKIGILTHYYRSKNFGGILQAYALTLFLNKNCFCAKQIPFDITILPKTNKIQRLILSFKRQSLIKILVQIKQYYYNLIYKKNILFIQQEMNLFEDFEKDILHDEKIYNETNRNQINEKYDILIVGSDQVFASYFLYYNSFYGEFTTIDKKVISYAASSDLKKFPSSVEKLLSQKLQRFNAISVREKTLKEYIESITDKKVIVVLDPTFLLSKEEWLNISNPKIIPDRKYIFCYFLGSFSSWQRKIAQTYADKYGYEVVHLPYIMRAIRPADKYLKGQGRYDVGPREFISLINNAECIFTDSFHGMAFSINFNKNFYVFDRDDQSGALSMNARITDMLDMLNLISRYVKDKNSVLDNNIIDYKQANKILEKEKEKSIKWLLNALKD